MSKAWLLAGFLLAVGCTDKGSLVYVTVDASYAIADAARLHVTLGAGGRSMAADVALTPATFPPSHSFAVDVGASTRGTLSVDAQLLDSSGALVDQTAGAVPITAGGRADLALTFMGAAPAGDDLAAPPGSDLAVGPDLATCAPSTASQTLFVDPVAGTDDANHGAAPGACANKSITFALGRGTGRINLSPTGTYQAPTETFPLVLGGTQIVDGDPNATGTHAHVVGFGENGAFWGAFMLTGTLNQLLHVDVSVPSGSTGGFPACVHITTAGPHVIDHDNLHDCQGVGVMFNNFGGAVITSDTIANVNNCLNSLGDNVTVKNLTCTCGNDGVQACGNGLTGCANMITCDTIECNACSCPAGFTMACP